MLIDFTNIPMFINIAKTAVRETDFTDMMADTLYTQCQGIKYGALALKIYNAKGAIDYTDEEVALLQKFLERFRDGITPAAYDALHSTLNPTTDQQ